MSGKYPEFFHVSVDLVSCKTPPKEVFLIFQHYGYENRGTFFELIAAPGVTSRSLKEEISAHLGKEDRVYVRGFPTHQLPEGLVPLVRREHHRQKQEEDRRRKKRITKRPSSNSIVWRANADSFPISCFLHSLGTALAIQSQLPQNKHQLSRSRTGKTSALPLKHKPRKFRE